MSVLVWIGLAVIFMGGVGFIIAAITESAPVLITSLTLFVGGFLIAMVGVSVDEHRLAAAQRKADTACGDRKAIKIVPDDSDRRLIYQCAGLPALHEINY